MITTEMYDKVSQQSHYLNLCICVFMYLMERKTFNHVYVDAVMSVQTVCLMYKLMMYSASGGDVCSSSWTRHQGSDPCCQL